MEGVQSGELGSGFWESLEAIYVKSPHGREDFQREQPTLSKLVPAIAKNIAPRYTADTPVGKGGASVVVKVFDHNLGIPRALKFPRPIPERESLLAEILQGEISTLLQAAHPNIIEIYDHNRVIVDNVSYPYYVMEFIEGVEDGYDFFHKNLGGSGDIVKIFRQAVEAVSHLHRLGIVHLDLKPANFLVSPMKVVKVSDLGSARKLSGNDDDIPVIITPEYAHPRLLGKTAGTPSSPNRARGVIKRSELCEAFDLYALGKSLLTILDFLDPAKGKHMNSYLRKYLHLMACRLLDGCNIEMPNERALGLPKVAFDELKYAHISEVALDLDKLSGICGLEGSIPEMHEHLSRFIQTSSLATTPLTERLERIISHPLLQRLGGISQLGLVIQVYPTATHSRLEHVLGTFSNTIRYIDSLYNDQANPFFKQIMTVDDMKAVLIASLCHDIGQFPLAHDLHEAIPSLFSHEALAISLLEAKETWAEAEDLRRLIIRDWGIDPKVVARILKADPTKLNHPIKDRILHTILDGPIDADKLDYLYRDSINLNVPYAKTIDFPRLLQSLTIIFQEKEHKLYAALGIHEKGKIAAESVAFARYALFGTVYWHHASRAAKAMLHRAVWEMMETTSDKNLVNFQRNFYNTFLGQRASVQYQISLPQEELPVLQSLTQMLPADREMLEWIAAKTTEPGRLLLIGLNQRKLFKRLLVVSARKNHQLWGKLTKFRARNTWRELVKLQREVQDKVVMVVRDIDLVKKADSRLTIEAVDRLVGMHANGEAIVLVDIPSERTGSVTPLEYLPETDRRDRVGLWQRPNVLEDSVVWSGLHDKFLESAGKCRIFCHPEILDILLASIKKDELEDMLDGALGMI